MIYKHDVQTAYIITLGIKKICRSVEQGRCGRFFTQNVFTDFYLRMTLTGLRRRYRP